MPPIIVPGLCFYGYIPPNQGDTPKEHLGVVLNVDGDLVYYCYGTSTAVPFFINRKPSSVFSFEKELMEQYFHGKGKKTYIYLKDDHIHCMALSKLKRGLEDAEYDDRGTLAAPLFEALKQKIRKCDDVSIQCKQDLGLL